MVSLLGVCVLPGLRKSPEPMPEGLSSRLSSVTLMLRRNYINLCSLKQNDERKGVKIHLPVVSELPFPEPVWV